MKKLSLVFILIFLCSISCYGAEIADFNVTDQTAQSGPVTVNGKHTAGSGNVVTIVVSREQIKIYADQTLADENGEFLFSYKLNRQKGLSGIYKIEVSGSGVNEISEYIYTFINSTDGPNLVSQINLSSNVGKLDGSEDGTVAFIVHNYEFLFSQTGILDSDFLNLSDSDKINIYKTLINKNFLNADDVVVALKTAISLCLLNRSDNVSAILEKYNDIFAPILNNSDFEALRDKSNIYTAISGKSFAGLSEFELSLKNAVALQIFNEINSENRTMLKDYVIKYQAEINLSNSELNEFNNYYNFTVLQNILNSQPYQSLSALKTAVLNAVSSYKNTSKSTGSSGVSSSGGGSGGNLPVLSWDKPNIEAESVIPVFSDLKNVPWAEESINALAQKGIVNGMADGIFAPDDFLTREQLTKMLILLFDLQTGSYPTKFTDVNADEWYYTYVTTAENLGLINGIGESLFGISRAVTREEMAVMLYRLMKYREIELTADEKAGFSDMEDISDYAKTAVSEMHKSGIINGMDDNSFMPHSKATRAMAAKILHSVLNYK